MSALKSFAFNPKKKNKNEEKRVKLHLWRHPLALAGLIAVAIAGAHWGKFIIVAIYYILFELWPPATNAWHHIVSDNAVRHTIRGVGEGLLGGSLGQMLAYNAYKKKPKSVKWYDKIEIKLGVPNRKNRNPLNKWQLGFWWVYVLIYAIPGGLIGWFVIKGVHHSLLESHTVIGKSYWAHVESIWTSEKYQNIVGIFASFFMGRRPIVKIADDLQRRRIERLLALHKPLRWYHTLPFRERYKRMKEDQSLVGALELSTGETVRTGISGEALSIVGIAVLLGAFGFYVLTVIA